MAESIKDIVKQIVDLMGYTLDNMEYHTKGNKWVLRVYIDKEGGVTLDDCESLSRELGRRIEEEDLIPHSYVLEVSSPGLDRPLRQIEDYVRYRGRLVRIILRPFDKLTAQEEGKPSGRGSVLKGRILSVEEGKIRIETEKSGVVEILFNDIANGRLEVEF